MIFKRLKSSTFSPFFSFTSVTTAYGKNFYDYPALDLPINVNSEMYQTYKSETTPVLDTFKKTINRILQGIDEKSQEVYLHKRQKLAIRERITKLLDPGSPFLELSQMAGYQMYGKDEVWAGGMVTGIGLIQGKWCMLMVNDPTIKGGSYYPITLKKQIRAQAIALDNNLPCVYLSDSGGVFLPLQEDLMPDKEHFGRLFYNMSRMSALGIPQVNIFNIYFFIDKNH